MASVIVAGGRTPFGKFAGAFKDLPAKSLGAHGARLVLTLAYELRRRGLRTGAAALRGGGGQGDALIGTRPQA